MLGVVTLLAAKLVLMLTPDKAEKGPLISDSKLLDYGYDLKPLWKNLPELLPSVLDVSIIIPCYNVDKFISRMLDSALNQRTRYRYEVIAIDDGSVDNTYEILEEYARRYCNLILFRQSNSGSSMARNRGLEMAHGEYVSFVDADDYMSPDYIEVLYNKAKQYDADMVQGSYSIISGENEIEHITPEKVLELDDEEYRWKYISGYLWCSIYRKSCFSNFRFPERFWFEDMICRMLLLRILKPIIIIGSIVYYYCPRENSLSVTQWNKVADIRSVDQYWLAKSLLEYSNKQLGCPINDSQYRQLISEWSNLLWRRTQNIDRTIRKTIFQLASAYLNELDYRCKTLTPSEKFQEKALRCGNFLAWELHTISLIAIKR